jgi:hypothetical protein
MLAARRLYYEESFVSSFLSVGGDFLHAESVARHAGERSAAYASILMERIIGIVSAVNLAVLGSIVFIFTGSVHAGRWIGLVKGTAERAAGNQSPWSFST